ncbi:hypothetical protein BJ508DRAFT_315898 [Ascobolus immersus RN42]|uniref:Fungal-type protein kinase domain-containing protein n=1 Tax=Ascobolus immersus RN42 TaxID=1160509 RepID=A0A3N4H8R3_ASCIM|nr:hypothetical protein BJ508DRAFT_315898 [Ascobolus immersus RN42]
MIGKGYLHRNISIGNILLTPSLDSKVETPTTRESEPPLQSGFLIDLTYAIRMLRPKPSGAFHRTGTPIFMAISTHFEHEPNPILDLHSFFYVQLYLTDTFFYYEDYYTRAFVSHSEILDLWSAQEWSMLLITKRNLLYDDLWDVYKKKLEDSWSVKARQWAFLIIFGLILCWREICFPKVLEYPAEGRAYIARQIDLYYSLSNDNEKPDGYRQVYAQMLESLEQTIKEIEDAEAGLSVERLYDENRCRSLQAQEVLKMEQSGEKELGCDEVLSDCQMVDK